jgi:hypothetical protein
MDTIYWDLLQKNLDMLTACPADSIMARDLDTGFG